MASPEISTQALSLGSEPRGDRFIAHRLYTRAQGPLVLLSRQSSKPDKRISVDLFDEGEFRFELKPGSHTGFLKEARVTRKRIGLSQRYQAFEAASRLANIVLANPVPDESIEDLFDLLTKGLDSWESGMNPQATYLKCLYVYCRKEGCPVKEEWAARLPPAARSFAAKILNQPLHHLESDSTAMRNVVDSLETYIQHHTHIRIERYGD